MSRTISAIVIFCFEAISFRCSSQNIAPTNNGSANSNNVGIGIAGSAEDVSVPTEYGVVLMGGGTDVDAAFQWMINRAKGGDFVIIRASGSTGYNDYVRKLGDVNSVETLLIDSREKALDKKTGQRIREAEALFLSGGDQANYVNFWTNSEVSSAIEYLLKEKKVPVGGTSAGCAILSDIIFDAREGTVTAGEALMNPYLPSVSLSKSFIDIPFLKNTIADQHYSNRERQGRHVAFLARMAIDFKIESPKGIGVDEQTAVCIDRGGTATVFGSGKAYFIWANKAPERCEPAKPLDWNLNASALNVFLVQASGNGTLAFNLSEWPVKPTEYWYVDQGILIRKVK